MVDYVSLPTTEIQALKEAIDGADISYDLEGAISKSHVFCAIFVFMNNEDLDRVISTCLPGMIKNHIVVVNNKKLFIWKDD